MQRQLLSCCSTGLTIGHYWTSEGTLIFKCIPHCKDNLATAIIPRRDATPNTNGPSIFSDPCLNRILFHCFAGQPSNNQSISPNVSHFHVTSFQVYFCVILITAFRKSSVKLLPPNYSYTILQTTYYIYYCVSSVTSLRPIGRKVKAHLGIFPKQKFLTQ